MESQNQVNMGNTEAKTPSANDARQLTTLEILAAGGAAGAISKTLTAPLDRVKRLYQVDPTRAFTWARATRTITKISINTGIEGLWRGNASQMKRVVPYAGVQFVTFHHVESLLQSQREAKDATSRFIAGSSAGAVGTFATYPFDLVRTRQAAHWSKTPKFEGYFPYNEICE